MMVKMEHELNKSQAQDPGDIVILNYFESLGTRIPITFNIA